MRRLALITIPALAVLLLATAPGALADTTCSGALTGTINGNVNVPDNATCNLTGGGMVTGNVTVGQNAALVITENWTIGGNLQASNCEYVAINPGAIFSTVIVGNVQIGNCTGSKVAVIDLPPGTAFGTLGPRNLVGGDLQCHNNTGTCVVRTATVKGNVAIMNNVSSAPSSIVGNTIDKTLQCQGNNPPPAGSGNTVVGNPNQSSEGQCRGF